jgi:Carboxypeptidase regulatory-like domain
MIKQKKASYYLTQVLLGILITLISVIGIIAQNNKGSIIGTVKDPSDAVIPNAKVVVTNNATGENRVITSGDSGDFFVTNLEPGNYKVSVEASGFKKLVFASVTVQTNARVPVEAKFTEVTGAGDNVVTISADSSPVVESETSARGDVITGREVTDLPIGQRNFTVLAALSPGVTRPTGSSFGLLGGGNEANAPNFPSVRQFLQTEQELLKMNFCLTALTIMKLNLGKLLYFQIPTELKNLKLKPVLLKPNLEEQAAQLFLLR